MAVAITTSTNGKYNTFSGTNSTLATAIAEVMNALDTHNKPIEKTRFVLTSDGTNFTIIAIVRN